MVNESSQMCPFMPTHITMIIINHPPPHHLLLRALPHQMPLGIYDILKQHIVMLQTIKEGLQLATWLFLLALLQ